MTDSTHSLSLNNITHPALTTQHTSPQGTKNSLSLYHANIHSLPHKHQLLVSHLDLRNNTPDIITLTDNYLSNNTNNAMYPLDHYQANHSKDVCVYYKDDLHIKFLEDVKILDASSIIIQIHKNKHKTLPVHTIINLYRRPNRDIPNFIRSLQRLLDQILTHTLPQQLRS